MFQCFPLFSASNTGASPLSAQAPHFSEPSSDHSKEVITYLNCGSDVGKWVGKQWDKGGVTAKGGTKASQTGQSSGCPMRKGTVGRWQGPGVPLRGLQTPGPLNASLTSHLLLLGHECVSWAPEDPKTPTQLNHMYEYVSTSAHGVHPTFNNASGPPLRSSKNRTQMKASQVEI